MNGNHQMDDAAAQAARDEVRYRACAAGTVEEVQAGVLMKERRPSLLDALQRLGGRLVFALPHVAMESFYVVVEARRYGRPESKRAVQFREELGRCLWSGERLVPFAGRLVVEGQKGAYRFHFNWEGNGKRAAWTADFREPECPIIPTHRSSMRMILKIPLHVLWQRSA